VKIQVQQVTESHKGKITAATEEEEKKMDLK
jgi:hypothetical protein